PHAVLIRAGIPAEGEKLMQRRRGKAKAGNALMAGPGSLSRALGITTRLSGTSLQGERIWIEDAGIEPAGITAGPRIGVDYAGTDAALPYRFILTS
ncbi:MAG TPA: DNA-3-methyladenine glycosylase, partial [Woeseiaceae bacterium]|nr:DNA-3-methyladenine glycosylase [Woeseiaceae bacterium]